MKTVTTVVTTTVLDSTICVYTSIGGSSQHVASLYTGMLLLELIPGATRPSTDINNNNITTGDESTLNSPQPRTTRQTVDSIK